MNLFNIDHILALQSKSEIMMKTIKNKKSPSYILRMHSSKEFMGQEKHIKENFKKIRLKKL